MRALVCIVIVACSAPPRPPVDTPIAIAPGPSTPPEPSTPECVVDADCEKRPRPKDTAAVCESSRCGAWSVPQLRAWAATTGLDLPESVPPPPKLAEVAWIDRKKPNVLFVDSDELWPGQTKARCVPIQARWTGAGFLRAAIAATFGQNPEGDGVTHYGLDMHEHLVLTGPGGKSKDGTVWGIGEARSLGYHLESSTDGALRYRGWRVRKTVMCSNGNLQIDPRCTPCERCIAYRIQDVSLESMTAIGYKKSKPALKPMGDEPMCVACPAIDDKAAKLSRFKPLTDGLVTLREGGRTGPAFFRKLGDCEKDRKERATEP